MDLVVDQVFHCWKLANITTKTRNMKKEAEKILERREKLVKKLKCKKVCQIDGVSVIEIGFLPELRQQGGWKSRWCTYECFLVPEGHFEYLKIVKKCQNLIKDTISVEKVLSI